MGDVCLRLTGHVFCESASRMIFLSIVLACLLIGSGLSAVFLGSGMIVLERGWSMVIAGSVVATGGVTLLGIAMLIREVRRLPERLVDTWSETLPVQHVYADSDHGQRAPDTAGVSLTQRPRVDHELSSGFDEPERPEPPSLTPFAFPARESVIASHTPEKQSTKAAGDTRPALHIPQPDIPQPGPREEPAIKDDTGPEVPSALKIQISLHNTPDKVNSDSSPDDLSSARGFDRPASRQAIEPSITPPEPAKLSEPGKLSKSFWSRLGRNDKTAQEPAAPVEPVPDLPTEDTSEPTAADLARSRLALADTPEREQPENITPKVDTSNGQSDKKARKEPSIGRDLDTGDDEAAPKQTNEPIVPDARISANEATKKPAPLPPSAPERKPDTIDAARSKDTASTANASPAVVGSYRSGPNLFVMYDDGTIESETPDGIFRFASLDKLKAYISSGEEPALAGERVHRAPTEDPAANAPVPEEKPTI